jgi:hypothetical protein
MGTAVTLPRSGLRPEGGPDRGALGTDGLDRAGVGTGARQEADGSDPRAVAAGCDDWDDIGIVKTPRQAVHRPCFPASFAASR